MNKLCSVDQAVSLIKNYDTVNITASGGGYMDADLLYRGIEKKFLETGEPNNLTILHITGVGSGNETGLGRFAHEHLRGYRTLNEAPPGRAFQVGQLAAVDCEFLIPGVEASAEIDPDTVRTYGQVLASRVSCDIGSTRAISVGVDAHDVAGGQTAVGAHANQKMRSKRIPHHVK